MITLLHKTTFAPLRESSIFLTYLDGKNILLGKPIYGRDGDFEDLRNQEERGRIKPDQVKLRRYLDGMTSQKCNSKTLPPFSS